MSMIVTIQVTRDTNYLEQIHNLVITNASALDGPRQLYRATIDGKELPDLVSHNSTDGALILLQEALDAHEAFIAIG